MFSIIYGFYLSWLIIIYYMVECFTRKYDFIVAGSNSAVSESIIVIKNNLQLCESYAYASSQVTRMSTCTRV